MTPFIGLVWMLIYKKLFYMHWFQQTHPKEKNDHEIPAKAWEVIGTDMLTLNNTNYLCIVDYHSKFSVIKKTEEPSMDSLIQTCKYILLEYGLLQKMMSDTGGNFVSGKCKQFCKNLNREQVTSSLYHHQSSRQVEACIKVMKHTIQMHWY